MVSLTQIPFKIKGKVGVETESPALLVVALQGDPVHNKN